MLSSTNWKNSKLRSAMASFASRPSEGPAGQLGLEGLEVCFSRRLKGSNTSQKLVAEVVARGFQWGQSDGN